MPESSEQKLLEKISFYAAEWTGSSWAFLIALALTLAWMISGPFFSFSSGWQLIMNTISSVSTFMMVFLLQRSQIKDTLAMQLKLNEIIAALQGANNRMISVEDLSEAEILALRKRYQNLATQIQKGTSKSTHSVSTSDNAK